MNNRLVDEITATQIRTDLPELKIGDNVIVGVLIVEGNKKRVQDYQGHIISIKGHGVSQTFKVRKISNGVGVERTFPVNSPVISYVKVLSHGDVRRAKLYYLRKRTGKAAKIETKI